MTRTRLLVLAACWAGVTFSAAAVRGGDDFELPPIAYSKSKDSNRVSRLLAEVEAGRTKLAYEAEFGYLRALLAELKVPQSSQMLVFSKTSLQRNRIAPRTPRALYFSDDVYIGYCQNGEVLEISVADPQLGTVFYSLAQDETRPQFTRQTDNCLLCHGSSQTRYVPGHVVRSVFADPTGQPILASGTYRIDHTSPLAQRWGGWYVTGKHGGQKHLGNLIVRGRQTPEEVDNSAGQNVLDLADRFDVSRYLTPHSDLVALMTFEHQAAAHNYLTQANFGVRQALHYQESLNRELKEAPDHVWPSTQSRIKSVCEPLLEYLLFGEEEPLREPLSGTSGFTAEFARAGPRDSQGRSLRDFDLKTRLFRYPCSYLIYSESFQKLPVEAKSHTLRRLWEVLTGQDQSKPFAHLSAADRRAILEILRDTLPDLPDYWKRDS